MPTATEIFEAIQADPQNAELTAQGLQPLYHVAASAEILLVSQAPSRQAQASMTFWDDASGNRLRDWMGVTKDEFYHSGKMAVLPLDFYYPGKHLHGGDLPPRKGFAEKWHAPLLALMPKIKLTLLIGQYAQKAYLTKREPTLTATVEHYQDYLPDYFPLVHPSPLNYGWQHQHPWFMEDVVPVLQDHVHQIMTD
ncbi:uracil-DNA glycosylase [Levilactobacillus senmaizukei DSM 21775 = NBRC 103853]|uniref:Uracil-DNA glycosylase n=1 Tax=Levilactobacillus senmaizukei DSM 21775 = NBRC 103853 TaxID=1423803 RepID=A0A0R2DAX0_9LACO|nr:uracil-DNA glycosylase family protein [Levilactobacillus senmaizukei]KRN01167.1 uracil-DNA glycosylase [Levilactobacillus senmaizukei DSM 21775 = NBRC 103853]